jgi:hypothetical protein
VKRGRSYERLRPEPPVQPLWNGDEPCRAVPEVFHPEQGDFRAAETAKWMCKRCPSKAPCLKWALEDTGMEGIAGGTTARQRARIRASRG